MLTKTPGTKKGRSRDKAGRRIVDISKIRASRVPLASRSYGPKDGSSPNVRPYNSGQTNSHPHSSINPETDPLNVSSMQESGVGTSGERDHEFTNPMMETFLDRPAAPNRRELIPASAEADSKSTGKRNRKSSNAQVWVPHEDKFYVYTYSSAPRLIHGRTSVSRKLYKGFHTKNNRHGRVIQGSNYTKDSPPKWNPYFAFARSLSRNELSIYETDELRIKKSEFRKKLEERARQRRENLGISSFYASKQGSIGSRRALLEPRLPVNIRKLRKLVTNLIVDSATEVAKEDGLEDGAFQYSFDSWKNMETNAEDSQDTVPFEAKRTDPEGKAMSIEDETKQDSHQILVT